MALSLIVFSAGTVIKSADMNSNLSLINSKLFDLKDENFNASAGLVDTKLATITTANKVNGSALVAETINGVKGQFFWGLGGTMAVDTNVSFEYEATCNLTITGVELRCKTAPTVTALIIDINLVGTGSLFSTEPQINAGSTEDSGGAALNITSLAAGDVLTVDVDQIGSGVAGSDVSVILKVTQKVPQ